MAERSPKNWDDPGNNFFFKNLFLIYIIWVDGGYQGLVNSEGETKKKTPIIWKEGGGASEGNWILMRDCQRCENKFKVPLASKWPPGCSQGGCRDPWTLALISCWKKGCWSFTVSGVFPFAGLTPGASRLPPHTDAPTGTCIYAVKTGG